MLLQPVHFVANDLDNRLFAQVLAGLIRIAGPHQDGRRQHSMVIDGFDEFFDPVVERGIEGGIVAAEPGGATIGIPLGSPPRDMGYELDRGKAFS